MAELLLKLVSTEGAGDTAAPDEASGEGSAGVAVAGEAVADVITGAVSSIDAADIDAAAEVTGWSTGSDRPADKASGITGAASTGQDKTSDNTRLPACPDSRHHLVRLTDADLLK